MGEKVYCSSSRALCAQLAVDARRSRTTLSWQEVCAGYGSSGLYVRESQYARWSLCLLRAGGVRVGRGNHASAGSDSVLWPKVRRSQEALGGRASP